MRVTWSLILTILVFASSEAFLFPPPPEGPPPCSIIDQAICFGKPCRKERPDNCLIRGFDGKCGWETRCGPFATPGMKEADPAPFRKRMNVDICENHQMRISCVEGHDLQILSAIYGRRKKLEQVCPAPIGKTLGKQNLRCVRNVIAAVRKQCDKKKDCIILVNDQMMEFGPCPGTYKYLALSYRCMKSKPVKPPKVTIAKASCPGSADYEDPKTGRCYHLVKEPHTYREAKKACKDLGGGLLVSDNTITNRALARGIWANKKFRGDAWTGEERDVGGRVTCSYKGRKARLPRVIKPKKKKVPTATLR